MEYFIPPRGEYSESEEYFYSNQLSEKQLVNYNIPYSLEYFVNKKITVLFEQSKNRGMNAKQIKEKYTCLDYLKSLPGERKIRKMSTGYLTSCPWRDDNNPSLAITQDGKGWKDMATGDRGNVVDLVMKTMNTRDLGVVCRAFGDVTTYTYNSSLATSKDIDQAKEDRSEAFTFFDVVPLRSRGLYAYLASRCINTAIAKQFLQEAHYSFQQRTDNSYLYALAYKNDKGGYELRGAPYKGNKKGSKLSKSPKAITTYFTIQNAPVVVFEGFMDMLSFATMCGGVKHNYLVLNSCALKDAAIEVLKEYKGEISLCLDNDDAGREATQEMLAALPNAKDLSPRYAPCKDINDYLQSRK